MILDVPILKHFRVYSISRNIVLIGARHFIEQHFVYCETSSKVFVELPVRRKVISSNAFWSKTILSRIFPLLKIPYYPISSDRFFSFQNIPENLGPSY